jgi:hypothetical protein
MKLELPVLKTPKLGVSRESQMIVAFRLCFPLRQNLNSRCGLKKWNPAASNHRNIQRIPQLTLHISNGSTY